MSNLVQSLGDSPVEVSLKVLLTLCSTSGPRATVAPSSWLWSCRPGGQAGPLDEDAALALASSPSPRPGPGRSAVGSASAGTRYGRPRLARGLPLRVCAVAHLHKPGSRLCRSLDRGALA